MLSAESWNFCTAYPSAGVAVTSETTPSEVILITAWPPSTWNDRTYVRSPSSAVVTVQPSSVVVFGAVVALPAGLVVGFDVAGAEVRGRRLVGAVVGAPGDSLRSGAVTLGSGAGKLLDAAAGSWASALSCGSLARSTGRMATLASTMLVAVAAAHPAIGVHREDPTRPSSQIHLCFPAWR